MKENNTPYNQRILVSLKELQSLCSCGRVAAEKIGKESGATIRVGRRVLYNLEKVKKYINSVTEIEDETE